ncbi:MAG: SAM-dependent methyltransferase [Sphingobacteriaceae bacterium]|nr:SAM-dependent methyltransferase [Sphingobacteriaceae bacterium]
MSTKTIEFEKKTKELIDALKSVCANYGLGNDGNEFKIITQVFLYKFLNDKFAHEVKKLDKKLAKSTDLAKDLKKYKKSDYEMLTMSLGPNVAILKPEHFISTLFEKQNEAKFAELFDDTLLDIAKENNKIFSVVTEGGEKIVLFENISKYVTDKRDEFCKAIVNKLIDFSFEHIFEEKFDFYATIFEYLIKDYNTNSGGKYAEYFTPHAVAKIMAACLVTEKVKNVTCYDPSAGSGTLLMNIAHAIGEDKCTIYSQDISQKSSNLLRLNLILNNLVHSIPNIVKGNTILEPYHREKDESLKKFDFIVSNPPFKLDFSDYVADLDTKENHNRFFAGVPNVPNAKKDGMAIYPLFIQHIMFSLSTKGKAAVVVPTGFITAQSGIERKIREKMVEDKMLRGVVSMPSNIFATTGTNVSILFLDNANKKGDIVLMDASKLGTTVKEGKNQKTLLSAQEEDRIINTFNKHEAIEDFSVVVSYEQIKEKNYSFSAGQYFDVKIEHTDITPKAFAAKMEDFKTNLDSFFTESKKLEKEIIKSIELLQL